MFSFYSTFCNLCIVILVKYRLFLNATFSSTFSSRQFRFKRHLPQTGEEFWSCSNSPSTCCTKSFSFQLSPFTNTLPRRASLDPNGKRHRFSVLGKSATKKKRRVNQLQSSLEQDRFFVCTLHSRCCQSSIGIGISDSSVEGVPAWCHGNPPGESTENQLSGMPISNTHPYTTSASVSACLAGSLLLPNHGKRADDTEMMGRML